jgi:hypothetical protein
MYEQMNVEIDIKWVNWRKHIFTEQKKENLDETDVQKRFWVPVIMATYNHFVIIK